MITEVIRESPAALGDISALIDALRDRNPAVRQHARERLVAIGDAAVEPLIELLDDRAAHVRWEAAKTLRSIGDPRAAPALVRVLDDDKDGDVRWLAAEALVMMGRDALEPLLVALERRPYSPTLQEGARHVLHRLSRTKAFRLVAPVLAAFRQFEPELALPLVARAVLDQMRMWRRPVQHR
jgi:HEAT repeat protein